MSGQKRAFSISAVFSHKHPRAGPPTAEDNEVFVRFFSVRNSSQSVSLIYFKTTHPAHFRFNVNSKLIRALQPKIAITRLSLEINQ